jgi:hypothetical protein
MFKFRFVESTDDDVHCRTASPIVIEKHSTRQLAYLIAVSDGGGSCD